MSINLHLRTTQAIINRPVQYDLSQLTEAFLREFAQGCTDKAYVKELFEAWYVYNGTYGPQLRFITGNPKARRYRFVHEYHKMSRTEADNMWAKAYAFLQAFFDVYRTTDAQ